MNHLAVCDLQDSNSTSYICVTSVYQSQWPLWWSLVCWVDQLAVCDMMRGPPSFLFSILHQRKAVMCRTLTVHHIQYMCNLSTSVKAASLMISDALNGLSVCLWYAIFWQDIIYICNLSTSVKVAPLIIFGAFNEPSGCLWYDERITKLSIDYLISLKCCDMQDANSISHIHATSIYQSMQAVQSSLGH